MNASDTPITDAAEARSGACGISGEICRELERQRNELLVAAQQALDVFINQGWDDDLIAAKNLKSAIAKATREVEP